MTKQRMYQVELSHHEPVPDWPDANTGKKTMLVCWVDTKVKPGDRITLKKDLSRWWTVERVYLQHIESVADLNRGWDNNI